MNGAGWNIRRVKVGRMRSARYTILKSFARVLGIENCDQVPVVGRSERLEAVPMDLVLEKIGSFREPSVQ